MKVLFYIEPLTERDRPAWKAPWIGFVELMIESLRREFSSFEFLCVVGDGLEEEAKKRFSDAMVVSVHHTELVPKFGENALSAAINWYRGAPEKALQTMGKLLKSRISPFVPDICISFSAAPFVKVAFDNIPVLHFELGLYSRPPFPMTAYIDPFGMFCNSYFYKNKNKIINYCPTDAETKLVAVIRELYVSRIAQENPLSDLVRPLVQEFKSSILVALQFSQFYGYDAHAKYQDQYDLLIQVLSKVPETTAVIAVEHPQHPILTDETLGYLQKKYKNLIWLPEFRTVPSASQYLMEYVNCVVTVSSSVGLQSILWKKPLIVLGHSHLDTVADAHDLSAFAGLIDKPWPEYKDRVLAWHSTRYTIPFELLFNKGVFGRQINKALVSASKKYSQYDEYFDEPFADVVDIISFYQADAVSQKLTAQIHEAKASFLRLESEQGGVVSGYRKIIAELIGMLAVPDSPLLKTQLASAWYLAGNPDLIELGVNSYEHWLIHGRGEGRLPSGDLSSLARDLIAERDKESLAERWQVQQDAQKAIEAQLHKLAEREQAFSAQIVQLHSEAEARQAELRQAARQDLDALAQWHTEREEQLRTEMAQQERGLHNLQREALEQQRAHEAELAQARQEAREEMEAQLHKQAEREQAFSAQIIRLHREAQTRQVELRQAAQQELDTLAQRHTEREEQLRAEFEQKYVQLSSVQQESEIARQALKTELDVIRATRSWRWTAALRRLFDYIVGRI